MSGGWSGSTRRDRLPPEWHRTRARIRRRDGHQCVATLDDIGAAYYDRPAGTRCPGGADHVDHILNDAAGGSDDESNLQSLCAWHHGRKSSAEGNAAKAVTRSQARRPPERHPGLL